MTYFTRSHQYITRSHNRQWLIVSKLSLNNIHPLFSNNAFTFKSYYKISNTIINPTNSKQAAGKEIQNTHTHFFLSKFMYTKHA